MSFKIIPFEYCSLKRAAKFFECEVEDFFHWWETGKIELCFYLNQMDNIILVSKDEHNIEFPYGKTAWEKSQSGEFDLRGISYADYYAGDVRKNDLTEVWQITGEAHGLWRPAPLVIERIKDGASVEPGFWVQAYGVESDFRIFIKNEILANADSLVIPKNELEKVQLILNGQYEDHERLDSQELLLLLSSVLKVTASKTKKWTQGEIAKSIEEIGIKGLKESTINKIFSMANKVYKSIN